MADRKITDLTEMAAGTQGSNDLLTIVDVSEGAAADKNKKITFDSLFKGIPGNVGIGIPSPGSKLHVRDNTAPPLEITRDQATNGSGILLRQPNTTDGNDLRISYQSDTTGTGAASNVNFAAIEFTSATHNNSTRAGEIGFYTAKGGEGFIQRMRIDSSGQVGIGTTSPGGTLHVDASGGATVRVSRISASASKYGQLEHDGTNTTLTSTDDLLFNTTDCLFLNSTLRIKDSANTTQRGAIYGDSSSFHFNAGVNNAVFYSAGTERMRLDSSGRLLRGLTSTSANANTVLQGSSGGTTGAARLFLQRGGAPANGQSMANIFFADNSSNEGAKISAIRDGGTWTSGSSHPTYLEFATTANGDSSSTERMRIGNAGHIGFGGAFDLTATNRVSINPADGLIGLGMDGRDAYVTGLSGCYIYSGSGASGTTLAGELIFQSRSNVNRNITFVTGSTPAKRMSIHGSGSVQVHGSFSKGSGSFKIDHPLPAKTATHNLVHSFIEGPQADLIYRGKVDLVAGAATVNLDTAARMTEGTFVLLNTNVQCFTSNESDWTAVRGSVSGNTLTIAAEDNTSTATVSWLVIGERQDQHMLDTDWTDDNGRVITEPEKPSTPVEDLAAE